MVGINARAKGTFWSFEAYEFVFEGRVSCYSWTALEIQPSYSLQRDAKAVCADYQFVENIADVIEFVNTKPFISFRLYEPDYAPNACRVHGSLNVNKVAGNFHITAGKSLSVPHGHIHISAFMTDRDYNFTHRINRFSFGGPSPGIVHPLEGDEKIADNSKFVFLP